MGENDRAIEAMRQKLNNQLLRKRMEQAAKAQANLERALEMSRSVDVHDLELSDGALEVDDADLFDVDIESALSDVDDLDADLDALRAAAASGGLEELKETLDELEDDLDGLDDLDLDDVDDLGDDVVDLMDEELDEMTTDDLELLESRMADLQSTLQEASRSAKLSAEEEAELLASMRSNEPPMLGEAPSSAGAVSVDDALAALAGGLRQSLERSGGPPELQAAAQLLDGLAGRLGQAPQTGDDVLKAYLDLARVLAASGAALALVVEKHLAR